MDPVNTTVDPPWETDAKLVQAAREGDPHAFELLFRRHARLAAGVAQRRLRSDQEIDDLVQESFTQALAKLAELREPQAFASWLASIVSAQAVRVIRRRQLGRRAGVSGVRATRLGDLSFSGTAAPEIVVELRAVQSLLAALPAEERLILLLRRVEELPLEDIAQHTGWSVGTVKRRLLHVERQLQRMRAEPVSP